MRQRFRTNNRRLDPRFVVQITGSTTSPAGYTFTEQWLTPSGWTAKVGGGRNGTATNPGIPLTGYSFLVGDYAYARPADGAGNRYWELTPITYDDCQTAGNQGLGVQSWTPPIVDLELMTNTLKITQTGVYLVVLSADITTPYPGNSDYDPLMFTVCHKSNGVWTYETLKWCLLTPAVFNYPVPTGESPTAAGQVTTIIPCCAGDEITLGWGYIGNGLFWPNTVNINAFLNYFWLAPYCGNCNYSGGSFSSGGSVVSGASGGGGVNGSGSGAATCTGYSGAIPCTAGSGTACSAQQYTNTALLELDAPSGIAPGFGLIETTMTWSASAYSASFVSPVNGNTYTLAFTPSTCALSLTTGGTTVGTGTASQSQCAAGLVGGVLTISPGSNSPYGSSVSGDQQMIFSITLTPCTTSSGGSSGGSMSASGSGVG